MSDWWIIALALFVGSFGVVAILLYHSRMPELDRSASRRRGLGMRRAVLRRIGSVAFARSLHIFLAVVGFVGFVLALSRSSRGLGEALIGLAGVLGFFVALWLKALRKEEQA